MGFDHFRTTCRILAGLSVLAGALGMPMSFLYLASRGMEDITAGASGFVAGAILIWSGVMSLSMLASSDTRRPESRRFAEDSADEGIMKRR